MGLNITLPLVEDNDLGDGMLIENEDGIVMEDEDEFGDEDTVYSDDSLLIDDSYDDED